MENVSLTRYHSSHVKPLNDRPHVTREEYTQPPPGTAPPLDLSRATRAAKCCLAWCQNSLGPTASDANLRYLKDVQPCPTSYQDLPSSFKHLGHPGTVLPKGGPQVLLDCAGITEGKDGTLGPPNVEPFLSPSHGTADRASHHTLADLMYLKT